MNDRAEQAFRDAFAEHGAESIEPVRPRRRFDARWALAAAVALVVLAVPIGLFLQGRMGSPNEPVVASPVTTPAESPALAAALSGLPAPEDGWKWVSRGDVAVQVPGDWPYSSYSWMPWCLNGATAPEIPDGPYVDSPEGVVPAIGCAELADPAAYVRMHVGFGASSDEPPLTETKSKAVGSGGVSVVLERDATEEDRALADRILATATTFERDEAGCSPLGPITSAEDRPAPKEVWDMTATAVGVCRYSDNAFDPTSPNLVGSGVLTDPEVVTDLIDGIASAPEGVDGNPDDCMAGYDERAGVVLRVAGQDGVHDIYVRVDGCRNLGFDDGVTRRRLVPECRDIFAAVPVRLDAGPQEVFGNCFTDGSSTPSATDPTPTDAADPTAPVDNPVVSASTPPIGRPITRPTEGPEPDDAPATAIADYPLYPTVLDLVRNSDLIVTGQATTMEEFTSYPDFSSDDPMINPYAGTDATPSPEELEAMGVPSVRYTFEVSNVVAGSDPDLASPVPVDDEGNAPTNTIPVVVMAGDLHLPAVDQPLLFLRRAANGDFYPVGGEQGVFGSRFGGQYTSVGGALRLNTDLTDSGDWAAQLGADINR